MKIFIVEDDPDSRLILKKNLENAGHEVIEAVHGEDALEKTGIFVPDLIISDILMPVMDGYKLCHTVKNDERLRRVPFIFYTATYTDPEDERLAMGLGASRFVLKPSDPEKFLAIIDEVIQEVKNGMVPIPYAPISEPLTLYHKFQSSLSRKLEDKVRELDLYRKIFDNSIEAIAVVNKDGHIIRQNQAHLDLFGYPGDELKGKTPEVYLPKEEMDTIAKKIAGTGMAVGESPAFMKNAGKIFVEYSVFSVRDEQDKIKVYVWLIRNITEHKRLEEQYRQSQKMEAVGRLSGGVAHDFNNLLTTILGYSEIAMMDLPEDSKLCDDLKQIHQAGKRAAALVRQLLAFSRKQVLEMRVIDLNRIIDNLIKMLRRLISENIDLQIVLNVEKPEIYADAGQIEQIIMNLTVNAKDAMPEGGTLLIKTEIIDADEQFVLMHQGLNMGPHVVLTVSDTGQGISLENQTKIFEPFFTTKELGKGTGLGLATVYGIVKQHHGGIYVYSEESEGTTFKVLLPLTEKPAGKSPALGGKVDMLHKGTQTILVVDDDEMVCRILKSALIHLGYTILVARNAASAIKLLDEYEGIIHMLLTDIVMPGISGIDLAEIVKKKVPDIKVVLMSGYAEEIVRKRDLILPEYNFIEKPILPSVLAHKLSRIFDAG